MSEDTGTSKESTELEFAMYPTPTSRDHKSGRRADPDARHTPPLSEVVLRRSTSSPADFHAKPSPLQASSRALRIHGGSGPNSPEFYGRFNRNGRLLRTSRAFSRTPRGRLSRASSRTWPRGGTMRNGIVYRQPLSAPYTYVTEFFSLHVKWATPRSSRSGPDYNRTNRSSSGGVSLSTQVGGMLNPTWVEWLLGFPNEWTVLES